MIKVNVEWETDGEDIDLPSVVDIPAHLDHYEIAEYLSNKYGWLVKSATFIK